MKQTKGLKVYEEEYRSWRRTYIITINKDTTYTKKKLSPFRRKYTIARKTWKCMNQRKMDGGTERHLPKTDDWHRWIRR